MANTVTVSGMFGENKTYFAGAPVIIEISDLFWGDNPTSPFTIVRIEVIDGETLRKVGEFKIDTCRQTTAKFDISSALQAMWGTFGFQREVDAANAAAAADDDLPHSATESAADGYNSNGVRIGRSYYIRIYTEYIDSTDGEFVETMCSTGDQQTLPDGKIPAGVCILGGMTEWERSLITNDANRDVSHLEDSNLRNGDASTKPRPTTDNPNVSPERVGRDSITSWVDVQQGQWLDERRGGTLSAFYSSRAAGGSGTGDSTSKHAPIVLRDSQPYVDFLFVNRRGALETCSALTKESMGITADVKQYSRAERPTFRPSRSLMAIGSDGRRSWQMSSGYVTREWAEWWTMEFLAGKRKLWWMLWQGPGMSSPRYVPVTIKPAKSDTEIYDKAKQQMPHVDFTVTLGLEG